ncbi:MAG: ATP-binding protein [Chloroflexi bacterium]|nr:ATP-binding protein [Chloroflexota bacterium]MCI0648325.1 ATP-binding protein [Chloroflexota bacterium]MCI0729568.1 ATP-binding protein [Chloroflexota bacterium]
MAEKVLVVDDSREIRAFLADYILKPKGYEIVMAENGLEGLEMVLAEKPDLMIVDNQMPKMGGIQLLRVLRERNIGLPAILTTAFGSEETAVEAFRLGVRDYVIKPFDVEEIETSVERALRESRLEHERDQLMDQLMQTNSQLERQVQELNTIYSIGKSVSSSLDLQQVLHRVVEAAVYITKAEEGFLMLTDEEQGELYIRASKNLDQETQSMRLRIQDSLAGQVIATNRPVVLTDDEHWKKIKTSYLVKSLIYIPLASQDQPIGVLGVVNRLKATQFERRDTRVLTMLSDYAALAIRNAHLFAQSDTERNKLGTILGQTNDPVLVIGEESELVLANQAARLALQLPEGNLVGRPLAELIQGEDTLELLSQPAGKNFSRRGEITVNDGRIFNVNMTLIEGVGRSVVMRDITQLKELDRLKSEFVSVVSHDLRSPLTSILGYIELLQRAGSLNDTQKEFVGRVRSSVTSITSLITDLLDLGRIEAGLDLSLSRCSLAEIMLEIIEQQQLSIQNKGLNLELNFPEQDLTVIGDRNRLHQAFSNLISNAIKYTPTGGKIGVRVHGHDGQMILQVSDTGVGISPADQPYIFDKFYRAETVTEKFEGTGLGLSIVKSVVERHDGRIWVTSEPGKGTIFTVVLPTAVAPPASSTETRPSASTPTKNN